MTPTRSDLASVPAQTRPPTLGSPHGLSSRADDPVLPLALRLTVGKTSPLTDVAGWIVLALCIILMSGQFFGGVNPQDEGEMLVYPWLVARGWHLYTGIWTMYPPASFLALAGLFKIGVPGMVAERGIGLLARLACILLINRALTGAWRSFSWIGIPLAFSLAFLTANISLAAYAWIVGLPVLVAALLLVRGGRYGWAAAAFALAGVFRIEFAIAGLVSLGAVAALGHGRHGSRLWRPIFGLLLALVLVYAVLDLSSRGQALQQILIDPVLHIEPYRRVSWFPPRFGGFGVPAALTLVIGPPLLALSGILHRRLSLAATNLGVCALLPQLLQDADWSHLFGVAAVGVPWTLLGLADLYRASERMEGEGGARLHLRCRIGVTSIGAFVALPYFLFVLAYVALASPLSPATSNFLGRGVPYLVDNGPNPIIARTGREADDDRQIIAYLRSRRAMRGTVFIAPSTLRNVDYNMTVLYYALGVTPASRYLEMDPGLETRASAQRQIIGELRRCKWVILWKDPAEHGADNLGSPLLERYIAHHYHPVLQVPAYTVLALGDAVH